MNYIGEFIRKYRGELSLREFSEKCGISHTHLDSIEKGVDPRTGKQVSVTVDTLKKIANAMGMTINDLLIQSGDVKLEDLQFDNIELSGNPLDIDNRSNKQKKSHIVYTDEESGLTVGIIPKDKPWEKLSKEEQENYISEAMDSLYEYKRNLKDK